jgi:hypothetical protein
VTVDIRSEMRTLLADAAMAADGAEKATLDRVIDQYDQPLRVAFAGMIKAGKSTLMNALVGQRIAATDAGECTRIVTRYQRGPRYQVTAVGHDGTSSDLRFDRGETLEIHLDGHSEDDIEHLLVDWPSERLTGRHLIDTPGLGSISENVSERSVSFLTSDTDFPVDAVVYLMRQRHPANLEFLEAFHGGFAASGGMSAIGVLSRADELAGGRVDALDTAARVASEMAADPRVVRLCQGVYPVAGLLAETASTLRQGEHAALVALAGLDEATLSSVLLGVDRFRSSEALGLDGDLRERLLSRFGIYGLRVASGLIASDPSLTADRLASELARRSGIGRIEQEIRVRFDERRSVLRVRAAMALLSSLDVAQDLDISTKFERIAANAHDVYELDLLDRLRGRDVRGMTGERRFQLERTLGVNGPSAQRRLGLSDDADRNEIRDAATSQLDGWRRAAEHPLASPEVSHLARMATRSLEALLQTGQPSA